MLSIDITLTPEDRQQLVATREALARIQEEQNYPAPVTAAICGVEMILECACPHNPEVHTLRDVRNGWEVTCHDCETTWLHIDH